MFKYISFTFHIFS